MSNRFFAHAPEFVRAHPRTLALIVLGIIVLILSHAVLNRNVITLRSDGFHPRTLTIAAGETITFHSERGKYFWPASDFHPTHTLYPAFDPGKPIAPESSWSFTFSEPGVYPFHDHLGAYYFGVIRVTDAVGKVPDDCALRGGKLQCWQNEAFTALAEHGLTAAYAVLDRLYQTEPGFAQSCHSLAHNIGLASYQFYVQDPKSILSPSAAACAGGFYHGFMEGYLGAEGSPAKAAAVCDAIGAALSVQVPDARLQCYHGIGHGAIETSVATTGDFGSLDSMVGAARELCEAASSGIDERYRCVSGLYNGIANFYINKEYGLAIGKQDPLALCSRQPEGYKDACYGNMNSLVFWHTNGDLAKGIEYLRTMPDTTYLASAVKYLAGMAAIDHVLDTDYRSVASICSAVDPHFREVCVAGFAHGLLEHGEPGREYEHALAFCATPTLSENDTATCYRETLGQLSGWYSVASSTAICATAPEDAQHYCQK